ncbi:hypothetical protein [Thiohalorhabdus sp.]|uniref:hypothetical protein n=1 Tax=Thiohalorhabdus sp. TaxID=3094134 RepID=UPI002FC3D689
MEAADPLYLLGVAIGFTAVPYFVIYLIFVLVTRRLVPIPYLLGGMVVTVLLGYAANTLARNWLGEDLLKTPVPLLSGVILAAAVIHLVAKWQGRGIDQ